MKTTITPKKYIQTQAISSAIINALLNGLIAFFTYRSRTGIPLAEAAVDIPITVLIIVFLVAWIAVILARQEVAKGRLAQPALPGHTLKLPQNAALRALAIAVPCVILFGGLILDGSLYLLSPGGFSPWAYILIKTLYTGATAALASTLAIKSVLN